MAGLVNSVTNCWVSEEHGISSRLKTEIFKEDSVHFKLSSQVDHLSFCDTQTFIEN
jgi:hypothetical protein